MLVWGWHLFSKMNLSKEGKNCCSRLTVITRACIFYFTDSKMVFKMLTWQGLWCCVCQGERSGVRGPDAESMWFMESQCEKHGAYFVIPSGQSIQKVWNARIHSHLCFTQLWIKDILQNKRHLLRGVVSNYFFCSLFEKKSPAHCD